jgi:hypothetical protein
VRRADWRGLSVHVCIYTIMCTLQVINALLSTIRAPPAEDALERSML